MTISVRHKIIINTIIISLCSIGLFGFLIYWHTNQVGATVLEDLEQQRLTSIRHFKSQQIINYFHNMADNIAILANNRTIKDAVKDFTVAFSKRTNNLANNTNIFKKKIIDDYLKLFIEQYKIYNPGKNINNNDILNLWSEDGFTLQYKYIFNNPYSIGEKYKLTTVNSNTDYDIAHAKYHKTILSLKEHFDFYDLFLINPDGRVIYTVNKEIDFTISVTQDLYANTGLSQVFQQVINAKKQDFMAITDFAPYFSFYDKQAAFLGTAVFDEFGNKLGVIIIQLSSEALNNIMMQDKSKLKEIGLGESVNYSIIGPDLKLRTENRFFLENKSEFLNILKKTGVEQKTIDQIKAKNTCVGLLTTDTAAVRNALAGKEGFLEYIDYRNIPVAGSFAPLSIPGLNWVMVVKINQNELLYGVQVLTRKVLFDGVIVIMLVSMLAVLIGIVTSNSIIKPVYDITNELNNIAQTKDLTKRLDPKSNQEFIVMINAFNNFISGIQNALQQIQSSVSAVESSDERQEQEKHKKDIIDLVEQVEDLAEEFKIIEDHNDRIKYW